MATALQRLRARLRAAARKAAGVVTTVAQRVRKSAAKSKGHLQAAAPYLKRVALGVAKAIPGVGKVVKAATVAQKVKGAIAFARMTAKAAGRAVNDADIERACHNMGVTGDRTKIYNAFLNPTPKYNKTMAPRMSKGPMRVVSSRAGSDGAVTIKFREYITDITSVANTDTFRTYFINPALKFTATQDVTTDASGATSGGTGLFSWMPNVSNSFQQYRIKKLHCEFVTTSGAVTTSQALGTILMGIQYDSAEKAFLTKNSILNSEGGKSCVPSHNMTIKFENARLNSTVQNLYTIEPAKVPAYPTSPNTVPASGYDPRLYYPGIVTVATSGAPTSSTLGQLWVNYEITLLRPRVP